MPMSEAMDKPGTMCPVRIIRRPGMTILHMCVELTISPFGIFLVSGSVAEQMLFLGVPAITKMDVALVSAMVCVLANANHLGIPCRIMEAISFTLDFFDMTTVASSLLFSLVLLGSKA